MSTSPAGPVSDELFRKVGDDWIASYQPKDEWGNPVGPPQTFKGKTLKECAEKVAAAHQNATVALHKTKKAVKIGGLLEGFDEETPMPSYEPRSLSAEEILELDEKFNNPATRMEAMRQMMEAEFGAPLEVVRRNLQKTEVAERVAFIRAEIKKFTDAHPEYVPCQTNGDLLEKWLEKRGKPVTAKNLEIAFADLSEAGLLTLRAVPETTSTPDPKTETAPTAAKPESADTAPQAEAEPAPPAAEPSSAPTAVVESSPASESESDEPEPEVVAVPVKTLAEIAAMTADEFQAYERAGGVVPQEEPTIPAQPNQTAPISAAPVAVRPLPSSSGLSSRASSVAPSRKGPVKSSGITWEYINSLSASEYDRKLKTDKVFAEAVAKLLEASKA